MIATLLKFAAVGTVLATATLTPAKAVVIDKPGSPFCGEMYYPPFCDDTTIFIPEVDIIARKPWVDPAKPTVHLAQARHKGSPNPNTHGAGGIRRDPPREIRRPDGPQRMTFD